jgi:hypothetical protein
MQSLPPELHLMIASRLDYKSVIKLSLVDKYFYQICNEESIWHDRYKYMFGNVKYRNKLNWKRNYLLAIKFLSYEELFSLINYRYNDENIFIPYLKWIEELKKDWPSTYEINYLGFQRDTEIFILGVSFPDSHAMYELRIDENMALWHWKDALTLSGAENSNIFRGMINCRYDNIIDIYYR